MYNYGRQTKRFTLLIFRSNKGASKQRRDQINGEISTMRDLLPLPESARQRLSQLQIMSLSCVFIRKCNVLQKSKIYIYLLLAICINACPTFDHCIICLLSTTYCYTFDQTFLKNIDEQQSL